MSVVKSERPSPKPETDVIFIIRDIKKKIIQALVEFFNNPEKLSKNTPLWLIDNWRQNILDILNSLSINIYYADHIYLQNEESCLIRKTKWDSSISYCYSLISYFQDIIDFYNEHLSFFADIISEIEKEISIIKKIKKSDNDRVRKQK